MTDTEANDSLVLFHEYGHHVDFELGSDYLPKSFTDDGFRNAYVADKKFLGLAGNKRMEKLKELKEELYNDVVKSRTFSSGKTYAYAAIELKNPALSGVSDTIDALVSGAFQDAFGAFGHGKKYFKLESSRYMESFANLFQLRANREHWEYARTKFPNMTKRLEELINDRSK